MVVEVKVMNIIPGNRGTNKFLKIKIIAHKTSARKICKAQPEKRALYPHIIMFCERDTFTASIDTLHNERQFLWTASPNVTSPATAQIFKQSITRQPHPRARDVCPSADFATTSTTGGGGRWGPSPPTAVHVVFKQNREHKEISDVVLPRLSVKIVVIVAVATETFRRRRTRVGTFWVKRYVVTTRNTFGCLLWTSQVRGFAWNKYVN